MNKKILSTLALMAAGGINAANAATTADIVFIVDESGSMSGEHAWLQSMVTSLDAGLNAAGVTNNRYGVVGYGNSSVDARSFSVGGSEMGSAADASTAFLGLETSGGTEDGYDGMNTAFNYSFRSDAAVNFILVTDEDRDIYNAALTYESILNSFSAKSALLNAVVNSKFRDSDEGYLLGVDSEDNGYVADGLGGYTTTVFDTATGDSISDSGTTTEDYSDLAWATYGAAWDLNQLRAGGDTAVSFTNAFIDIKVNEIVDQPSVGETPVPLPAAFPLFAAGLAGLGFFGRRNRKA